MNQKQVDALLDTLREMVERCQQCRGASSCIDESCNVVREMIAAADAQSLFVGIEPLPPGECNVVQTDILGSAYMEEWSERRCGSSAADRVRFTSEPVAPGHGTSHSVTKLTVVRAAVHILNEKRKVTATSKTTGISCKKGGA